MNTLFNIKTGDLSPPFRATLYQPSGTPQDLTGCAVRIHVRKPDGTLHFDRAVSAIENALGGIVRYDWQAGDTTVSGRYTAEFQVTLGASVATYPNDRNLVIVITPELA
jgi:BppU N-terminal domain